MHKIQMYENLRDMLEREVKDIEKKGDLDVQSLDNLYKLMAAIKNTDKCIDYMKAEEGGMSNGMSNTYRRSYDNRSYDNMSNRMMPEWSYDMSNDGMSNDGMSSARRGRDGDSDGRYNESRDNFRNSQDRGQSYENSYGYSRDASKKKMVQKLETLMDDTMSEHERQAIMDCINKIK